MSRTIMSVMKAAQQSRPQEHVVLLGGGLNLAASNLEMADGQCVQLENYEINTQGDYQSVTGFERFDGRPAPSEAKAPNGPYLDDETELTDLIAERELRRSMIQPVSGSGPIRGVFYFKDRAFAFRDTADGTACKLWGSSETGWVEIPTPTLAAGGDYQFRELNFPDRPSKEIVGVDGVNHAFIFDGTTFTQIVNAGMDATGDDKPIVVEVLPSDYLLLGYRGGSLQYSAAGKPLVWDVAEGAGEILVADEMQELDLQPKDGLAIYCRNRSYILYGRTPASFELTNLNTNTGAIRGTVQTIGDSVYLDDRGLTRLSRVQSYGNFDMTTLSQLVDPLLESYRSRINCSVVIREKNQYRLFFKDGGGLICTFYGGEVLGFTTFNLGENRFASCTYNAEKEDGSEVVFFGGEDGYVYQLERGTSFDGDDIVTVMRTSFSTFGPEQIGLRKRLTRATIEAKVVNSVELRFMPEFDYSDPANPEHLLETISTIGGGGYWGQGIFDESYWSAAVLYQAPVYVQGRGENVSSFIRTVSSIASPHIIASVVYRYVILDRRR